ncbi:MAG: DUF4249 domain-containing protein, partial [Ginsengibacter sp.]
REFFRPSRGWGLLLLLTSCEKVIDINLNNAAKKYVIEGIITNEPGFCKVQITQTVNFSEANTFPWVSGAIVTVTDNNNSPITLVETVAGTYQTSAINGTTGHAYRLSVNINGEVFSATSQMPAEVKFDSLFVEDFIGFGDIVKYANVVFKDPPGKGNAYRFKQYKNGLTNKTIFVINDDFSDGRINTVLLPDFANDNDDDKIKSGDTVKVDMQCIDARVYKYWFSLSQSGTGGNNNASPANPLSNITGGALGYFSAHTVQTKSVVVQ